MLADGAPFRFDGFASPNTTAVPDEFFDVLAPNLSEAELRVMLYIIRRTFGFKKAADPISFSQFLTGITTHDGRVLDNGCGLRSRGHLSKSLKSLIEKGVIVATKSQKANGSQATTSYGLRFKEQVVPETNHPGSRNEPPLVPETNPQKTDQQETERQRQFENSNDSPQVKIVDNLGITGYLDNLIVDISREFGDTAHLASNCKQARNVFAALDLSEEVFVEQYVYQARQKTKHQTKVRAKMPYFFATLRTMCGLNESEKMEGMP
jgi:hypothetical protein